MPFLLALITFTCLLLNLIINVICIISTCLSRAAINSTHYSSISLPLLFGSFLISLVDFLIIARFRTRAREKPDASVDFSQRSPMRIPYQMLRATYNLSFLWYSTCVHPSCDILAIDSIVECGDSFGI